MKIFTLTVCLFLFQAAIAQEEVGPVNFGHLLSQTTETMSSGQCTVGVIGMGCGLPGGINIVSSPFLYSNYSMHNFVIRWSPTVGRENEYAIQYAYFKSTGALSNYTMEAHSLWGTKRYSINAVHRLYLGFNFMNFVDETAPFSLRREPFNGDPTQSTVFVLNDLYVNERISFFVELAALGLNFVYPNYHFGASLAYRSGRSLFQFGLSATGIIAYAANSTYHTQYRTYKNQQAFFTFDETYKMAVSVHPELNWQYYF